MNRAEAQAALSLYREGVDDPRDPFFAVALECAARDPELAQWLAAEQRRDNIIAEKLEAAAEVPIGLRNNLLEKAAASERSAKSSGNILFLLRYVLPPLMLLAAMVLFFARPAGSSNVADFRSEMVDFTRFPPHLDLKTHDLAEIKNWLQTSGAPPQVAIPVKTQSQLPVGCRTLMFRGQKVALICFLRQDNQLIHLLVVNRSAFPHASLPHSQEFVKDGEWMTATWAEGDMVYLLTTKGDRAELEQYL